MQTFLKRSRLPVPAQAAFGWHQQPGAFERLVPPWSRVEVVERSGDFANQRVVMRLHTGPIPITWIAQHGDVMDGRQFKDRQESGPFAHWVHTHRFIPASDTTCDLEDHVEYQPPLGALAPLIDALLVRETLASTFAYRHRVTAHDLQLHSKLSQTPLQWAISGASGLIGSSLRSFLSAGGHGVKRLVRHAATRPDEVEWSAASGILEHDKLNSIDVVVHLAGESIARRWTPAVKNDIRNSRVEGTRRLCAALAALPKPPRVLISASAIGFYGNRGSEPIDESSPGGDGFLATVCREWEEATQPAAAAGIRVVHMRLGVVLTPAGGALAQLRLPFRAGLGGRVGDGKQFMSWIALDDVLAAILHCAREESLRGAVNLTAPQPVSNEEFTKTLGRVLRRPTVLPLPTSMARLVFGEMADEMLLGGARVHPSRLTGSGFSFWLPDLEGALRHLLGATPA